MYHFSPRRVVFFIFLLATAACTTNTSKSVFKFTADSAMPNGAWTKQSAVDGKNITEVLVFVDGFFSHTAHETGSGAFLMTHGGSYTKDGLNLKVHYEFNSADAAQVGIDEKWAGQIKGKELLLSMGGEQAAWQSIDVGQSSPLTGAWIFAARKRDGEMQSRSADRPRKTMKLLTATRFQWIAFDTSNGKFSGTGGGEYTGKDGVYTEKIGFFSRDDKRVGAELPFEFRTEGSDWHHSGKSSKGDPIYEIWAKRMK